MKKEILIISFIIVFIIVAHSISQIYTQKIFDEVSNDLDSLEERIIKSDFTQEELEDRIESILNKWKTKFGIFAFFIEHDELEKVQTHLISIKANIKAEDYNRCIDEVDKCKFVLKHIEEKDSFKIINIF